MIHYEVSLVIMACMGGSCPKADKAIDWSWLRELVVW